MPPANGKLTSPKQLAERLMAEKALVLRMEGLTFAAISEQLGYGTREGAYHAVRRALDRVTREPAEALLKIELERLDVLWQIQYLNAQAGDVQALAGCMRLMERRARMLGLDAPVKSEVTGKDGQPLQPPELTVVINARPPEIQPKLQAP